MEMAGQDRVHYRSPPRFGTGGIGGYGNPATGMPEKSVLP